MGKGRQALDQVWRPLRFTYMARESCSHLPAFLGTAPTGCRAFLAMADVVFGAFLPAGVAGIGADLAECCCEGGTAGHLTGGDRAEVGATVVETDAPGHHRYVIFGETRACAVFTCQRACLARLNAFLIFFHMVPFWFGLRVGDACRRGGMQPAHRKRGGIAVARRSVFHPRMFFGCHGGHAVMAGIAGGSGSLRRSSQEVL